MLQDGLRSVAERELGRPPAALAVEAFKAYLAVSPDPSGAAMLAESARRLGDRLAERGDREAARAAWSLALLHFERLGKDPEMGVARQRAEELRRHLGE